MSDSRWLPFPDHKPKEDEEIIICDEQGFIWLDYYIKGKFIMTQTRSVSAWMPLPEPYKGESEVDQ